LPFDDNRFDTFKEHGKLGGTDECDGFAGAGENSGNPKATGFKPLVPKGVTIPIPVKNLEPVSGAIDKNEKSAVKRILLETIFDNRGKSIERLPHIDGSSRNVNGVLETV